MSKMLSTIFPILLIFLASSVVIKEVEAQRLFQYPFYRLREFFSNLRTNGNNPSISQDSSDHSIIQEPVDFDNIGPVESEPELVTTLTEIVESSNAACSTVTEFFPPFFNRAELKPITITVTERSYLDQPPDSKTITVTETKLEPTTVTSIQITTLCEEKSRNIVENESCDICLRQDELDDLFDDTDGGDVLRTRLVSKKGTSTKALVERRREIQSTFTEEN